MTKQLPNLQVALDHSDLKGAIAACLLYTSDAADD